MAVDFGDGRYGQRIGVFQAAAIVRINADPTASTNVNGVGYPVSGTEMIPLDGTTVVTVRAMSPTAGAYIRFGLANPTVY